MIKYKISEDEYEKLKERSKKSKEYRRSKKGLIFRIYRREIRKSKERKHHPPKYTRDELYNWLINNETFNKLYDNWVKSGYKKDLVPSVDRLNDKEGYSFENVTITTFRKNYTKSFKTFSKPVLQFSKKGNFIKHYKSVADAARSLRIDTRLITSACSRKKGFEVVCGYIFYYESLYLKKQGYDGIYTGGVL